MSLNAASSSGYESASDAGTGVTPVANAALITRSCSTVARATSRASRDRAVRSVVAAQATTAPASSARTAPGRLTSLPGASRQYRCVGIGELLPARRLDRRDEQLEVE